MDDRILECFQHILDSIDDIEQFTHHLSFETYEDDVKTQAATERKFEIVGAALARLAKIDKRLLERISDHGDLLSLHNRLARGDHSVDNLIVWGFVEARLITLKSDICTLL